MNELVCEGAGLVFTYVLPKSFSLKELSVSTLSESAVIKVYGGADGDCEYAALIVYNGEYNTNLNLLCDKIEFQDSRIQTLTHLNDIARRAAVMKYECKQGRYEHTESYAVYLLNAALRPAHEALIPFAFFQAIKAGDFPEARYFLSDSLNSDIESDDALSAYFEDFDIIEENKYFPDLKDCIILKTRGRKKNTAKLLYCKLDGGGKIDELEIK